MTDRKGKRKRGGQPKYPGEEQVRLSVIVRPRYKEALELLAAIRGTSISEAMEFSVADMASRYEVDGKPLLDYVRPPMEAFNRYRSDAVLEPRAFQFDGETWEMRRQAFMDELDKRKNAPPSLREQFDNFVTEVLDWLQPVDYAVWRWFNMDALIDALKYDWREGKSIEQTAATIILVAKLRTAEHIYSYRQGDAGTLAPEQDTVQLSAAEMAEMEKMLDAPDWIRYREFFKQV